jgi:hypothetical protein
MPFFLLKNYFGFNKDHMEHLLASVSICMLLIVDNIYNYIQNLRILIYSTKGSMLAYTPLAWQLLDSCCRNIMFHLHSKRVAIERTCNLTSKFCKQTQLHTYLKVQSLHIEARNVWCIYSIRNWCMHRMTNSLFVQWSSQNTTRDQERRVILEQPERGNLHGWNVFTGWLLGEGLTYWLTSM